MKTPWEKPANGHSLQQPRAGTPGPWPHSPAGPGAAGGACQPVGFQVLVEVVEAVTWKGSWGHG